MNQLGNFEQNLLTELRGVVAERAAGSAERVPGTAERMPGTAERAPDAAGRVPWAAERAPDAVGRARGSAEWAPEPSRRRVPRRRLVLAAAGAGVLAAAVVLGMPAVDGPSTPAAYAVRAEPDGTVLVSIERFEDAEGLERAIEAHGISAEVDYTPFGQHCQQPRWPEGSSEVPAEAPMLIFDPNRPKFSVALRPDHIGDRTVVIEHTKIEMAPPTEGHTLLAYRLMIVEGPVAPCVLVPSS